MKWAWEDIEARVKQAAEVAGLELAQNIVEGVKGTIECGGTRYGDSPIEAVFMAWWEALAWARGCRVDLWPQEEVSVSGRKYRLDFTVRLEEHPGCMGSGIYVKYPLIAYELDGHDFHEKTKEQVTYRNQRDRDLQAAGWKVYHVSGSELYRDPYNTVSELLDGAQRAFGPFWAEYWSRLNDKVKAS